LVRAPDWDALKIRRTDFSGNRLRITSNQKTGKPHSVIIRDHVVAALFALPLRPTVDANHFFWSGKSLHKSLTSQWQRKLGRLNNYLSLVDDEGKPMRFHSHQLRDTSGSGGLGCRVQGESTDALHSPWLSVETLLRAPGA